MDALAIHADQFVHIRIIVGMLLGLSLSRLVTGLARSVQTPAALKVYPIHVVWIIYLLLSIVDFWWFEFGLLKVKAWTFGLYLFVLFYTSIYVFLVSILFPDRNHGFASYERYFQDRRRAFYWMLVLLAALDVVDSSIKGSDYLAALGVEYFVLQAVKGAGALAAVFVRSKRYQLAYAGVALACEIFWLIRLF